MTSKVSFCCLFMFAACVIQGSVSSADVEQPIVKTSTATFRGKRLELHPHQLSNEYHRSVSAFMRIPYAEPPLGQLRFARPVGKVIEGEFDATRKTIACPQKRSKEVWDIDLDFSEDCLTLDIFVPEPKPKDAAVMMWIHGGGYHVGAGSIPEQLPTPLAAYNDVIVVTINYRLGSLGFLATGDGSIPANLGLLDQRQALIWIQDNIEAFGGDPSRVTIFGESAGSGSVNLHLLSTMSAGLFSGAIMQSGALTTGWTHYATMREAVQMTYNIGKAIGCDVTASTALVRCLRSKTVDDFISLYQGSPNVLADSFYVHPVADGQFLADDPIKMASQGAFNQADVINGCTKDEGSIFFMPAILGQEGFEPSAVNRSSFRQMIGMNLQTEDPIILDFAEHVFATSELLDDSTSDFLSSISKLVGDYLFLCPTFDISEQLSRAGRNVYTYVMTHAPSVSVWGSKYNWMGAAHTEDIPYVFGSPFTREPEDSSVLSGEFGTEEEVLMALQIMKYWSNFAKTGDPNLSTDDHAETADSKYPVWSKFTPLEPGYKELSPSFVNHAGKANAKECYFLNDLVPSLREKADEMARLKLLLEETVKNTSRASCVDSRSCPDQ